MVQIAADVGGERAELVIGEVGPSLAGQREGALVLERWDWYLEMLKQGVQHAKVKRGVVSHDEVGGG